MADTKTGSKNNFITFGCRLNAFETEVMRDHAGSAGVENTIFINSCAVTTEAVRQARQKIRKASRDNPDARIVVTGCAAQIDPSQFSTMPEVHLIIGNVEKGTRQTYERLAADKNNSSSNRDTPLVQVSNIMHAENTPLHRISGFTKRTRAFVQIQNGCDHRCTFCVIPFGRGPSRSIVPGDVIAQIRQHVDAGIAEVILTGVDITSYGTDLTGTPSLGSLVKSILKTIPKLARLRLSSIDSVEVDADLFDALAHEERLMPHLHLSLQSGDSMILKRMKRRHSPQRAVEFCQKARDLRSDIVFGADLIAGFPTETDQMFENSLTHVTECDLTQLHVFPYSPRPGTPAALMPQLPRAEITSRAKRLRDMGDKVHQRFLLAQKGMVRQILIERPGFGYSEHFAKVELPQRDNSGEVISARITGARNNMLNAEYLR